MTKKKSFTLIELIIVIAIIGILSTVGIVSMNNMKGRARDARRKDDLKKIQTALEVYQGKYGYYPYETWCDSSIGSCAGTCLSCGGSDWNYSDTSLIGYRLRNEGFFQILPKDPINDTTYFYYYEPDCDQNGCSGCCRYSLGASLEGGGWFSLTGGQP